MASRNVFPANLKNELSCFISSRLLKCRAQPPFSCHSKNIYNKLQTKQKTNQGNEPRKRILGVYTQHHLIDSIRLPTIISCLVSVFLRQQRKMTQNLRGEFHIELLEISFEKVLKAHMIDGSLRYQYYNKQILKDEQENHSQGISHLPFHSKSPEPTKVAIVTI